MKSIQLPSDIISDNTENIILYDYHTSKEILKQQVILDQNTFSFLVEGTKEVIFDNSCKTIDQSQFILMKAGHCLMTEKLSTVHNYRSILLFFSNDRMIEFINKYNISLNHHSKPSSVYTFVYDDFTSRFIESLSEINRLPLATKSKLLNLKLEEIMLYLLELYGSDFLLSFIPNNNTQVQKFTQTIESNILNKLTLNELAFLCNMSLSTFKREFEKQYAESPSKWFQNKRLEYAHTLLTHKNKTVTEIYLEIGYESTSSFIQAYKSKYGITPKQHTKQ
ncbi:helix-turn-helix transcriptional regulator [Myroides marinus]|uniref:helix-turn-helix domain-containing protein n=1 Tax=Myroides marinus TaxID=703342 RepID=UPI002576A2F5|nr:AraC family transcriptional regulator [Myroides marinus]MDM1391291.1 helix-turn-helix transcriptional regulator [Myroides marinus]